MSLDGLNVALFSPAQDGREARTASPNTTTLESLAEAMRNGFKQLNDRFDNWDSRFNNLDSQGENKTPEGVICPIRPFSDFHVFEAVTSPDRITLSKQAGDVNVYERVANTTDSFKCNQSGDCIVGAVFIINPQSHHDDQNQGAAREEFQHGSFVRVRALLIFILVVVLGILIYMSPYVKTTVTTDTPTCAYPTKSSDETP